MEGHETVTNFGVFLQWKRSVQDINGEVLCGKSQYFLLLSHILLSHRSSIELNRRAVSQFTLLASTKKGSKPDFHGALGGDEAKRLYQYFYQKVQAGYRAERVKDGVFQAMMEVALVNDGPVRNASLCPYVSAPGWAWGWEGEAR